MGGFFSGIVGACAEAWQEVRIHKGRVLLSLVGVAVAVCALSGAMALSGIAQQATLEQADAAGGRPATLSMTVQTPDGTLRGSEGAEQAWFDVMDRYEISYATRVLWASGRVQFPDSVQEVSLQVIDQPYAEMHRTRMTDGAWFQVGDSSRLAPAIVVNTAFWEQLGSPNLATHPVVSIESLGGTQATIIGVHATSEWDTWPSMYMLTSHFRAASDPSAGAMTPVYEMWVPTESSAELATRIQSELGGALGATTPVSVERTDWGTQMDDPTAILRLITMGIGGIILLLGALSLLNIALVTVRQRIREIGIRRSFGATSGRVFFAVMMESVVATFVAGVVGVIFAVLLVQSPLVANLVNLGGISDVPPFPASAAVFGLVVATIVGALAGLIPALIAVRVKVIDAIRY